MKKPLFALLLLLAFSVSSCFHIVEELRLKKDGSGTYSLTFDLGELLGNPMLKEIMEENGETGLPELGAKMDTLIKFTDLSPEQRSQLDRPAFWDKVEMRIIADEASGVMKSTLILAFDDLSDIAYFYQNLDKFQANGSEMTEGIGGTENLNFLSNGPLFELSGNRFSRLPTTQTATFEDPEEAEFAKLFFASGTYTSIYHLPGKVKKVSNPQAVIDDKQVTLKYSLTDILNAEAKMECNIRFK